MAMLSDSDHRAADPRYAQVRARDRTADGAFVYAVRTTGVFCRPSCGARPARPENIAFYDSAAEAEAAGFRPCKRCRPNEEQAPSLSIRMRAVAAEIDARLDTPLPLSDLARIAGMSASHLQRSFKSVFGITPKAYHAARRLAALKAGLRAGDSVLGAMAEAGYGSTSRLYALVDDGLGMTPSAYRAGGAGEMIVHATRDTALGPLMMAASGRGVCFAQFGDGPEALRAQLAAEFPRAELRAAAAPHDAALDAWMEAIDAHLSRGAPSPDLPVDLRGTAFQIRVWRFLLGVKPGERISYADVARGIGAPRAVRAAASACAANRIGVLVPCHRVLRGDGGLGGYRWGVNRKRALLDREREGGAPDAAPPPDQGRSRSAMP
ncbi:bifunctional DNA-binding transcriptional regulator/O6-methylguanine-DNA methyltransferase Ada [Sphingomonas morindae]|uniref:Bifunctional DNA-binding transcriptional regulator/O6-methylguanine-DNA methyltransferase Ada n=1 Tax=Sphingomonas morindae TaxID=1541170 RepID=A0ABY4XD40_9SPHN|nr:bifunctional DNA-binding transcriptional regulator/O6-methylguanine-DNA methyltransferase Ada [Sphingomonas morindae]USI74889.1 bifunctional DNA-binding transcriptional regulator/O6-methylguanine-DNA methyltransferase Ada [Sphingomonas morindae]